MPSHIADLCNTGKCGTIQTLAQAKGAFADLIKKEQARSLAHPCITPSNQPTEWFGADINKATPSANKANESPTKNPRQNSPSQPSFMMQILLREEQKQAQHEQQLRQFKQLAALQLVKPLPSGGGSPATLKEKQDSRSGLMFLGEPVRHVAFDGTIEVAETQQPLAKSPPAPSQQGDALHSSGTNTNSQFADANEVACFRAVARKERQQKLNQKLGIFAVDQSASSPMFHATLRDPVDEDAIVLCDDSPVDRRRLEGKKHQRRDIIARAKAEKEGGKGGGRAKQTTDKTAGTFLPQLSPTKAIGASSSLPPSPQHQQTIDNATRDMALLSLMQEQARTLERQVALEARGAWESAEAERKRREGILRPKPLGGIPTLRPDSTPDEEALVRAVMRSNPAEINVDTRNRRQRLLQYMEDNKQRSKTVSVLEKMRSNTTAVNTATRSQSSAANQPRQCSFRSERSLWQKGHQPSSLFPHKDSLICGHQRGKKHNI